MKDFIFSALPFVLEGIALAILAANYQVGKQKDEHFKQHLAMGAGFGLLLGVALNSCGLWENHILGIILGPLWGMAVSTTPRNCNSESTDHNE